MRTMKSMKTKTLFIFSLPLVIILLLGLSLSAQASSLPQSGSFQTPTPGSDGRIIYTVRDRDNCFLIAYLHGIDENLLRAQNPVLGDECIVIVGQRLLIGIGGPAVDATVTPGPSPTPTLALPTPTPFNGTTEICVLLFHDINGNALREELELALEGGAVSVTNRSGDYSETQNTVAALDPDTLEPIHACFVDVPEGTYSISVAIPDGYNPTIEVSYELDVNAGDRVFVAFGAQSQSSTLNDPMGEDDGNSGTLGILGVVLLLGGGGLAWYATHLRKTSQGFNRKF